MNVWKRDLLKRMLRGEMTVTEATASLQEGANAIIIVVETACELYRIGGNTGLTKVQMLELTAGRPHVILDEESERLGSTTPVITPGRL